MAIQLIKSDWLGEKLCAALGLEDNAVRRIIVDVNLDHAVQVYVEMFGSKEVVNIDWAKGLQGAEIQVLDK